MASANLTKAVIAGLQFNLQGPGTQVTWDTSLRGMGGTLGVRVYKSGDKSFVLSYRFRGQKKILVLGPIGSSEYKTVQHARRDATTRLTALKDDSVDPASFGKKGKPRALKGAPLVRDVMAGFRKGLAKLGKSPSYIVTTDAYIKNHINPSIGNIAADQLTLDDVTDLHEKLSKKTPVTANRVMSAIRAAYNWDRIQRSATRLLPVNHPNPGMGVLMNPEESRKKWVKKNQMPDLVDAIEAEKNPYFRAFIYTLMHTGFRAGEALKMRWADVDFEEGAITIPDTKNHSEHVIPVSNELEGVLKSLDHQEGNPWVFCGAREGERLVNYSKPWNRIRKRIGDPDLRVHDLRRTVASWMVNYQNASMTEIGAVLNHKTLQTTKKVYATVDRSGLKRPMADHSKALGDLLPFRREAI